MKTIIGLAHIGIRVREFNCAIGFYRQLGFTVIREDYAEHVVVMRHMGGLELNLLDSATTDNGQRNILMDEKERYPGVTHIALRVSDIAGAAQSVRSLGIPITEGPVTFGDGSTSIFFRDPDRNVIELSQAKLGSRAESGILYWLKQEWSQ